MDMMNSIQLLRHSLELHFGVDEVENLSDDQLGDLIQDVVTAQARDTISSGPAGVDTVSALVDGVPIDAPDGVLVIVFKPGRVVVPKVAKLGLMSEAVLELNMMNVFMEINKTRQQAYNKLEATRKGSLHG